MKTPPSRGKGVQRFIRIRRTELDAFLEKYRVTNTTNTTSGNSDKENDVFLDPK